MARLHQTLIAAASLAICRLLQKVWPGSDLSATAKPPVELDNNCDNAGRPENPFRQHVKIPAARYETALLFVVLAFSLLFAVMASCSQFSGVPS